MVSAKRVSLFERQVVLKASSAAVDLLFEHAQVLSEGQVACGQFFGSTMITTDLTQIAAHCTDACDADRAARLGSLIEADTRVRERARDVALLEACRVARGTLARPQVDFRVRVADRTLRLDIDVEADTEAQS